MKTTDDQTFLAKNKPGFAIMHTGAAIDASIRVPEPKLIVTRAILTARVYQRRIQACTPTLMSQPFIYGGEYV